MSENPAEMTQRRREYRIERRTFWASVAASVVASILFGLFFQPIVNGVSNVIVSTIGVFYKGYIDRLYYDAANSPADHLIYLIFALLGGLPAVIYVGMILGSFLRRTIDQGRGRRVNRFLDAVLPIMMIALFIITAGPEVTIRANATFQRRLMALTPVITDDERKRLLGEWAMVNSKEDYLLINNQLEELAKKHSITFPERSP